MAIKINISEKSGKTFRLESDSEELFGKELHNKIKGGELSPDLEGWEFEITGASDSAGFPATENVEGIGLKKVLLNFNEKGMNKRPKHEGKRARAKNRPKGLRLRKTVRGKVISQETAQINLKVLKEGSKKLSEVFPEQNLQRASAPPATQQEVDQNKAPETAPQESPEQESAPKETAAEQKPAENAEALKAEEKPAEKVPEQSAEKSVQAEQIAEKPAEAAA